MREPLSEADLDRITGQVFATPAGKQWLKANEHTHPEAVAEVRERIARCRQRWGDRSTLDE